MARTTVNLDEKLVEEARRVTGTKVRTALIHDGFRALIERESARRLARLGGSEPGLRRPVPRRRPPDTEALSMIKRRALMGRGMGYIEVHLLASAALAGDARLWTRDRRLVAAAAEQELVFDKEN